MDNFQSQYCFFVFKRTNLVDNNQILVINLYINPRFSRVLSINIKCISYFAFFQIFTYMSKMIRLLSKNPNHNKFKLIISKQNTMFCKFFKLK